MNRTRSRNTLQGGNTTDKVYVVVHNPHTSNQIRINNTGLYLASGYTTLVYDLDGPGTPKKSGWDGVVETISDVANQGFSNKSLAFNDCEHTKLYYSSQMFSSNKTNNYPGYLNGVQVCVVTVNVYYDVYCDTRLKAFPPVLAGWDSAALRQQAIASMKFEPDPKLDLPLNIAELRDFGHTFGAVSDGFRKGCLQFEKEMALLGKSRNGVSEVRAMISALGQSDLMSIKRMLRSPGNTGLKLVGLDLFWKFALKPLIDGCMVMSEMMTDLEKMRNNLANPTPYRVRGTAKSSTTSSSTGTDTGTYRYDRVIERSDEAHAWALVQRKPYDASYWEAFRKVYDVRPKASTFWALFTCSFVIDWFVNVGRFIRQFEKPMVCDLDLIVLDTAWSTKRTEVYQDYLYFTKTSGAAGVPVPTGELVGVASTTGTQYVRSGSELLLDSSYIEPVQIGFPDAGKVWSGVELILSTLGRKQ